MVEFPVIEEYLKESTLAMTKKSRSGLKSTLIKFLNLEPTIQFENLTRQDFLDKYSHLLLISTNSFYTHKSKINDFAKWLYEHNYCSRQVLNDLRTIRYEDIDRSEFYATLYFRDITDLYSTLSNVFAERGTEFDTFRTAAILVWFGFDKDELHLILKSDLNEDSKTITHPITNEEISLECDISAPFYFILRYRDADSCDSRKFGGRTLSYPQTKFLLRTYKNPQLTATQVNHLSASANEVAEDYGKIFQWRHIYLSGLYYRLFQYEQKNGSIENNIDLLNRFLGYDSSGLISKQILSRKYNEYLEFKSYMY